MSGINDLLAAICGAATDDTVIAHTLGHQVSPQPPKAGPKKPGMGA